MTNTNFVINLKSARKTREIMLNKDEANEFVMVATLCPFEISISHNHYQADAKSVVDVLSMDFSKVLTLEYEGYDPIFERYLSRLTPEAITA